MIYFATSLVFIYLFMIIFHKSEDNDFYRSSAIIGWLTILLIDIIFIIKC